MKRDVIAQAKVAFIHESGPKKMGNPLLQDIVDLYLKILITPHIGSATDLALADMIKVSLRSMDEYLATGKCKNSLIK